MLAHSLRVLFAAWCAAVVAVIVAGAQGGWPPGIVLILLLLVGLHPLLLGVEFLIGREVARRAGALVCPLPVVARAWAAEWLLATRTFAWRMPWRTHAQPDHLPANAAGRRGVVLVHGFVCNRAVWNPSLARLRSVDRPVIAVDLVPVFGEIEAYVPIVEAAVARMETATGRPPVVLAHSMGGLAVRAWMAEDAARAARVHRVITIATPHRGTWLASLGLTANARQMRMGGQWQASLVGAAPHAARFTCWWSACDQVVFPPPVAEMPGAESRPIHGVAHLSLIEQPEIWDDLLRRLNE